MTSTKKVTAHELDAQIGYNEQIDTDAIVAKMKGKRRPLPPADKIRELTQVRKPKKTTKNSVKSDAEVIKEITKKISETLAKVEEKVVKVHIEPSRNGVGFEVWVAYKRAGYIRTLWKPIQASFACDAMKIAEEYINQMDLVSKEVTV